MKVRVSIEIDIPSSDYVNEEGKEDDYSNGCVHQLIFDNFINFAICQHLYMAMKYVKQPKNKEDSEVYKHLHKTHNEWADLIRSGEKTLKIESVG
jgi:hypothetical protein